LRYTEPMIREKQSITIEIDPEVLAFLEQRHEHGEGDLSQQLERLARHLMPNEAQKALDEQHRCSYENHPMQPDEFAPLIASQVLVDARA
jgi:hypothetical protein